MAAATWPAAPPTRCRRSGWPRAWASRWPSGSRSTAQPLVDLLGHDPAVVDEGVTYLRISTVGIPFQLVTMACIGYLYGLPDTRRPFLVLAASTSLNLVVELLLVFGFDRGVEGSAWGTVLAQTFSAAVLLAIVVPSLRSRRAAPAARRHPGDVGAGEGGWAHRAADRIPARRAGGGHRGGAAASARRSWAATRSRRSSSSSSPSASTCSRSRASPSSAMRWARRDRTRRATWSTTSTGGGGGRGSC